MQAKKRFILLVLSCAFLALCYIGGHRLKDALSEPRDVKPLLESYLEVGDVLQVWENSLGPLYERNELRETAESSRCRMNSCFDFSRCRNGKLSVYVYPADESVPPSPTYRKILNSVLESTYYTSDPSQACLFVLALDTLDRDTLSSDYVRGMRSRLARLLHWNGGKNHLIFNFYSGTWPDYSEDLGFDIGKAILAKASISLEKYRPDFDISLPLVHKEHMEKGGDIVPFYTDNMATSKNFVLGFKGKRYVYGIGSETRNSLYHLHNGKDIIMVTTCKHGKNWKELKDERCEEDNAQYDRYDYEVLLQNSTFCLVPRGRRLGSFRFVEVLQAGCVPVLLSNGWVLPFSEVIDWSSAAVFADERLLLQVPDVVRSIDSERIFAMRQQAQLLWQMYFSSIDRIVFTTLEIIRERVERHLWRDRRSWNRFPGGLATIPLFADSLEALPFSSSASRDLVSSSSAKFTGLVYVQSSGSSSMTFAPLLRLVRALSRSQYVDRIVLLWSSAGAKLSVSRLLSVSQGVPVHVVASTRKESISERFKPLDLIETDAVFSLDEDVSLTTDEIDFAFRVWSHFPERIVGFPARLHFWDDTKGAWGYTSKWTNEYSIVLTGAAVYHRYYQSLYADWLSPLLHKTVDQLQNCEDILMNFLVSHVTRQPPIKVSQRKQYKDLNASLTIKSPWSDPDHFVQRQTCLNAFSAMFGYMPLLRSSLRFDPVLYKDPVSNLRKKYRQMELTSS